MADNGDKKKKKSKKSKKSPQKVLEDAGVVKDQAGVLVPEDAAPAVEDQADSKGVEGVDPQGYEECVFSIRGTDQPEGGAASMQMSKHKYDEMKFAEEGKSSEGVSHTYNDITFHQPGVAVPVPSLDPVAQVNRGHLTLSGSYELPRSNPAPTSEYMSLQKHEEKESEYHTPDVGGNNRVKRLLGGVTRQFTFSRAQENTDSAFPSDMKRGSLKWILVFVVAVVCVTVISILLSIVALALSAKCTACPRFQEELNAVQTQLRAMNSCASSQVANCTFSSGPTDPQASCVTAYVRFSEVTSTVRSLGCVVTTASPGNAGLVATLFNDPSEGYYCQCFQTGNDTVSSEVGCSLSASMCGAMNTV